MKEPLIFWGGGAEGGGLRGWGVGGGFKGLGGGWWMVYGGFGGVSRWGYLPPNKTNLRFRQRCAVAWRIE